MYLYPKTECFVYKLCLMIAPARGFPYSLSMALPALRNVDVTPVEQDGETVICLRDPDGFVEEQIALSPPAFFIATCLDGTTDVVDIQQAFARQFQGVLVMSEDILKIVEQLDEIGFLLTDRFFVRAKEIAGAFFRAETRPAYISGASYPSEPEELRSFLDGLFMRDGAPGELPGTVCGEGPPARCAIVPHIDFQRGGAVYAHGYLGLFRQGKPKTVILFGVAHASPDVPYILTRKHFATPFGILETDRGLVERLAATCDWNPFEYEIVHRTEHSIEFQAVMLAYLYGTDIRIVPILCGPLAERPERAGSKEFARVAAFLDTCREIAALPENRVAVVAGADLAHVGRRFGDDFDIDVEVVRRVETRDREDLAFATAADPEGFYRSVVKDANRRNVCGLVCIYSALKAVQGVAGNGRILDYSYAPDPAGGIVSFASVLLSR